MKPYHRNPRRITKKRYDRLTDTLSRLGDLGGIVHNLETDEVIGGNQRMTVFKNGEPVVVEAYDQPDEQGTVAHGFVIWQGKKYAYRQVRWDEQTAAEANIAANLGAGDWDWDALSGWDAGDLQAWGFDGELLAGWQTDIGALRTMLDAEQAPTGDDPGAQVDKASELQAKWGTATGQLWALGEHRLICGDCTDAAVVARVMDGEKADTIITDPPYNVDKAIWDTDILPMLGAAASVLPDFLTQDGICFWFTATRYIPHVIDATSALPYRWMFIWYPSNNMAHGDLGFQKFTAALVLGREKVWRENMQDLRDFPIRITKDDPGHPTPKPIELIEYLVSMASMEIVFDGFLGSGTTLIACERLARRCRAIEISPAYCAVAIERWHVMTGRTPVLLDGDNG